MCVIRKCAKVFKDMLHFAGIGERARIAFLDMPGVLQSQTHVQWGLYCMECHQKKKYIYRLGHMLRRLWSAYASMTVIGGGGITVSSNEA